MTLMISLRHWSCRRIKERRVKPTRRLPITSVQQLTAYEHPAAVPEC
jgi:hypothetical protein